MKSLTLRQAISRAIRNSDRSDTSNIARRARLVDRIQENTEDGQVALHIWQMDCDCASWEQYKILPAIPVAVNRYIDRLYYDAEGPVRISFILPSETDEPLAPPRDHALEAFEDGHPHVVHV